MPRAALIEVLEWPTPKVSYSLSARLGKRCQSTGLLDGRQALASAREHLVRVGLMSDVPDQPVMRRVEHIMQGDGQLDGAQAGGEMSAAGADALDQELAQFRREGRQRGERQAAQIRRGVEARKQRQVIGRTGHPRSIPVYR